MRKQQLLGKEPWFFHVPELKQKGNGICRTSHLCQKKDNLKYLVQAPCRKFTGSAGESDCSLMGSGAWSSQSPGEPTRALVWGEPRLLLQWEPRTAQVEAPLVVCPGNTPALGWAEPGACPPPGKFLPHQPSSTAPTLLSNNQRGL